MATTDLKVLNHYGTHLLQLMVCNFVIHIANIVSFEND